LPRLSLLIVNYRTVAHTARAIASARCASAEGIEAIVVDNSGHPSEAEMLGHCGADRVVVSPENLGYGGGLNLARTHARGAILILSNPDVVFDAGSIDAMAAAVAAGAGAVAPRLSWDSAGAWLLPPADEPAIGDRLSEAAASRWPALAVRRDRRRIRARLRFWTAQEPMVQPSLPGAVLCLTARTFDRAGGFDPGFFLYFEEHDLLRRVRNAGGSLQLVPAARCRHLYNQSARSSSEAGEAYARSERRFFEKWYPRPVVRAASRLSREQPAAASWPALSGADAVPIDGDPADALVEASPLPSFATAAGFFPKAAAVAIPDEIWSCYQQAFLYLRVVDRRSAQVLRVHALRNPGRIPV
jgi:N-acetylglucosaminyl-diphospho-decaprenol L-rhamnosyltransferase